MWLYIVAGFLVLLGLIGGVASGGIFTLIFIPLALIMLVVAVVMGMFGRAAQGDTETSSSGTSRTEPEPLRHTEPQGVASPATPEDLVDARRVQQ